MKHIWCLLFGAVALGALVLTAISPVMRWWLPMSASTYAPEIDRLFYMILITVTFFYVLTEAILVYNLYKFAGPDRKSQFSHGNHKLELVWSIIPGVILIALAVIQVNTWANIKYPSHILQSFKQGDKYLQIGVEARQWEFRMRYASPTRMNSWDSGEAALKDYQSRLPERIDDIHLVNDVHVWKGVKVLLHLKTRDVGHAVFFPNLRLKQDAMPGRTIPVWFEANVSNTRRDGDKWSIGYAEGKSEYDRDFDFDMVCTQYCGTRHSLMRGKLYVHPTKEDFLAWLAVAEKENNAKTVAMAER